MDHTESFLKLAQAAKRHVQETTIERVRQRLEARVQAKDSFALIDVREDNEWAAGHLPGALHLGRGIIERDIEQHFPDFETAIILYCGGGYRSALTAESLQKMGYANVLSMDGGFTGWSEAGLTVVATEQTTQDSA
jgi:rhodanese-related sulfurtransferase